MFSFDLNADSSVCYYFKSNFMFSLILNRIRFCKVGVNSEMLKNRKVPYRLNFNCNVCKIIHFYNGNDSENPFLTSKFAENSDFLRKWQKITLLVNNVKKKIGQPTTRNFELKMLKLHEDHLKTNV